MDQEQAWRPIGELEAPRLLAALVEPKEPAEQERAGAVAGRPRQMAGNRGRSVAAGAIVLAGAGALVLWWIPPHEAPTRASLPGIGIPGSAASARAGDAPGAIQEPDVNKRIAAAVVAGAAMAGSAGAQTAVQWRVEDGGNGHWYQRIDTFARIDWSTAKGRAESLGGYLACLESQQENLWLWNNIINVGPDSPSEFSGWIGLYQMPGAAEPLGGWMWITGSPLGYFDAAAFDNASGFGPEQYGCYYRNGYWASWADNNAGGCWTNDCETSFVVEWSADCNNDGIVDYGQCRDGTFFDGNANNIPDCCEQSVPCTDCYRYDLNPNGIVDGADLGALLAFWGPVSSAFPRADLNRDGMVDGADLGLLLANWGPCGG